MRNLQPDYHSKHEFIRVIDGHQDQCNMKKYKETSSKICVKQIGVKTCTSVIENGIYLYASTKLSQERGMEPFSPLIAGTILGVDFILANVRQA